MATTLVVPWAELLPSSEPANPLVPSIELLLIGREGRTWKANYRQAANRSRWVQRLDEPLPSPILRQQRQATVAGEREKVWLTVVVVLHLFARRWIGVQRQGELRLEATQ